MSTKNEQTGSSWQKDNSNSSCFHEHDNEVSALQWPARPPAGPVAWSHFSKTPLGVITSTWTNLVFAMLWDRCHKEFKLFCKQRKSLLDSSPHKTLNSFKIYRYVNNIQILFALIDYYWKFVQSCGCGSARGCVLSTIRTHWAVLDAGGYSSWAS